MFSIWVVSRLGKSHGMLAESHWVNPMHVGEFTFSTLSDEVTGCKVVELFKPGIIKKADVSRIWGVV